ncbi:hypothetical protein SVAN01_09410 [Stagonosporopsis vannaccii]|nr:hypothetical protein SVAN01_09410 [Stagonosporopsis vannaccii]
MRPSTGRATLASRFGSARTLQEAWNHSPATHVAQSHAPGAGTLPQPGSPAADTAQPVLVMPCIELHLLALEGGGVRGVSALIILAQLMEAVDPDATPKPYDYFDLIGGTSTGRRAVQHRTYSSTTDVPGAGKKIGLEEAKRWKEEAAATRRYIAPQAVHMQMQAYHGPYQVTFTLKGVPRVSQVVDRFAEMQKLEQALLPSLNGATTNERPVRRWMNLHQHYISVVQAVARREGENPLEVV